MKRNFAWNKACKNIIYWTSGIVFLLAMLQCQGLKSHCDSIKVYNGSSSIITCYFEDDISKHKRNIYLDHLPENHSDIPEVVMSCRWKNTSFRCVSSPGYQLYSNLTNNSIGFLIPVTLPYHAGKYWCDTMSSEDSNSTRCQVDVIRRDTHTDFYKSAASVLTTSTNSNTIITVNSSCKVVRIGSTATLTCCFNSDISYLQTKVYVDHVSVNGSEVVLSCGLKDGNVSCNSRSGYKMSSNVSKILTVQIPTVGEEHSGEYWCDVLQSEPATHESCMLDLPGKSKNITTWPDIQEKNGTDTSKEMSNQKLMGTGAIVGITMGALVAATIVIFLIFCLCSGNAILENENENATELERMNPSSTLDNRNDSKEGQYKQAEP